MVSGFECSGSDVSGPSQAGRLSPFRAVADASPASLPSQAPGVTHVRRAHYSTDVRLFRQDSVLMGTAHLIWSNSSLLIWSR